MEAVNQATVQTSPTAQTAEASAEAESIIKRQQTSSPIPIPPQMDTPASPPRSASASEPESDPIAPPAKESGAAGEAAQLLDRPRKDASADDGQTDAQRMPPPKSSGSGFLFRRGPNRETRIKFFLQRTFGLVENKELQLAIRKHGGEIDSRLGHANIVVIDEKNIIEARKAHREATSLGEPLPVVRPDFVFDSVAQGSLQDLDKYQCSKDDLKSLSTYTPGSQPRMNGRMPFTAEDREYIVRYFGPIPGRWNLNAAAGHMANDRPRHTKYSWLSYMQDNMTTKWNIAKEVAKWRQENPELAPVEDPETPAAELVEEQGPAGQDASEAAQAPAASSLEARPEEESEPEGGWGLAQAAQAAEERPTTKSPDRAEPTRAEGQTNGADHGNSSIRRTEDSQPETDENRRDSAEVEEELEIRAPRPAAVPNATVQKMATQAVPHDTTSEPEEESQPEGGWGLSESQMARLELESLNKTETKKAETSKRKPARGSTGSDIGSEVDELEEMGENAQPAVAEQKQSVSKKSRAAVDDGDDGEWVGSTRMDRRLTQADEDGEGIKEIRVKYTDEDKELLLKYLAELLKSSSSGSGADPLHKPSDAFWDALEAKEPRHSAASWKSHFMKNREAYKQAAALRQMTDQATQVLEEDEESSRPSDDDKSEESVPSDAEVAAVVSDPAASGPEAIGSGGVEEDGRTGRTPSSPGPDVELERDDRPSAATESPDEPAAARKSSLFFESASSPSPAPAQPAAQSATASVLSQGRRRRPTAEISEGERSPAPSVRALSTIAPGTSTSPDINERQKHHDAKVAAQKGDPTTREYRYEASLSPTLEVAAAAVPALSQKRTPGQVKKMRGETRGEDESPFPKVPAFMKRSQARHEGAEELTRLASQNKSTKRGLSQSQRSASGPATRPIQPIVKAEEIQDDEAFRPPPPRRFVGRPSGQKRRAARKTFGGFDGRASASAGVPIKERHRDAMFLDLTMNSDEEEAIMQMRHAKSGRAVVSRSRSEQFAKALQERASDEGSLSGSPQRVTEWLRSSAEETDESKNSRAVAVKRTQHAGIWHSFGAASSNVATSDRRISARPLIESSSARDFKQRRVSAPSTAKMAASGSTSRVPSAVASGHLSSSDAAEAKARFQESIRKLGEDYGLPRSELVHVLEPNGYDVVKARASLEEAVQRAAQRHGVTRKVIIEFIRASDGDWTRAEKAVKVHTELSPARAGSTNSRKRRVSNSSAIRMAQPSEDEEQQDEEMVYPLETEEEEEEEQVVHRRRPNASHASAGPRPRDQRLVESRQARAPGRVFSSTLIQPKRRRTDTYELDPRLVSRRTGAHTADVSRSSRSNQVEHVRVPVHSRARFEVPGDGRSKSTILRRGRYENEFEDEDEDEDFEEMVGEEMDEDELEAVYPVPLPKHRRTASATFYR